MILKNWKYVILRGEKFLMTWIVITAMCLDFIWISFAADDVSQINYLKLTSTSVFTYILLVTKVALLFYLLFIEKSFSAPEGGKEEEDDI
jgi:hypothetical protein